MQALCNVDTYLQYYIKCNIKSYLNWGFPSNFSSLLTEACVPLCPLCQEMSVAQCRKSLYLFDPYLDSFTVSLHNPKCRHLSAIRACKGAVSAHWKTVEISTGYVSPYWGNPNLHLDKPITKGWSQANRDYFSYDWQSYCHQAKTV